MPIGRPNQNVYAYVLDQALKLVPAGVVGELYLGGAQLARGYRARPVLTAERFVADPFGSGGRLYRTGDLVRRNARGELEFVGRADEQVKVRGYRIELGEIEAVIGADPRVGHCVATVVDDPQVGSLLAAYVVPAGGTREIDLDELRARAQEALPAYMVPTAFAVIPEIPLTTSGKLDKRALPTPDALTERAFRLPVTPTERRMCAIYSHLFGKERVGLDDSFFELGGHSLLAARLVAQIRAQFGIDLTVRAVFDRPTPAGLAEQLVTYFREEFEIELDELDLDESDEMEAAPQDGRPDLVAAERPERLPLSSSQLSMWFECQMEGVTDIGNMWLALRFDGPLQTPALIAALNDVVARHEALRTNIAIHEGAPYQIVHPSRELAVPILRSSPEGLSDTLAELRHHIFGLETESLIRPAIIELSAQEHVLALVVHHIVVDHASFTVIVDDLIAAYRARLEGQAPQWDPQPVQYADYVLWQRDAFAPDSEFGQAEVNFWRQQLAGVPTEIAVAHDRARPQILGKRGEVAKFVMEPERRQALTRMAEQRGVTEFMVYQAALAVVLHRLGGGTDIVIGSPVAARVHPHVAKLVGLFANMVALRNDLSGDPSLRSVLERSRDATLNAHAHQELPIEKLVEAVNPVRSLSWNPLFQTMVNFRGADWGTAARDVTVSGETTVVPLPMEVDVSYLDLNFALNVTPSGGLDVSVVANADLYDHETTRMIAQALDTAFDAFVNNQESRVSEIVLLPADAMAQLMAPPAAAVEPVTTPSVEGSEETKLVLISILEELLEISDVDPEDNFFALGGDSVISIQWSARPQILGKRGEVAKFVMEPERRQALTRMAEQRGVTEFMVYQAALAVVLHRLGGGTDIVIGSPVAARVHPHVAKLVGLFANMVALRNDLSGDPSLRSVLERSRDATLNAHAHQELPIEKLVEAVNPVRSLSWNPLFQTMVNFRGADWGTAARDVTVSGETTVVPLPMEVDVSYLDLNFALNVTPSGGLDVSVVANADLYDHETTRMIAQALDTAFDAFVNNQESRVSEIVLLPADAMAQLMAPPAAAVEPVTTPSVEGSEETKLVLISILEELLEISDVDPEDNFFALGGDSVISIQWSTRAAERGLAMTPQMVFECATIAQLAGAVDAADRVVTEGDSHLVTPPVQSAPMSASGLSADALAELTASWQAQS
ncbi:Putative peptide synthetase MbtE [Mycobacteroides abscessus subsp. abscessus]|nr:Putative peptide synthetase MbtE [Mycobacteroides abscessus subsp. abscessus]